MTLPHWFHHPEKDSVVAKTEAQAEELKAAGFTTDSADSKHAAGRMPPVKSTAPIAGQGVPADKQIDTLQAENDRLTTQNSRLQEAFEQFKKDANQRLVDLEAENAKLQESIHTVLADRSSAE